jgi:hypothetical protein
VFRYSAWSTPASPDTDACPIESRFVQQTFSRIATLSSRINSFGTSQAGIKRHVWGVVRSIWQVTVLGMSALNWWL